MATSRSTRFTFITGLALTFVVIVTLGATGENLPSDVETTNGNNAAARSDRVSDGGCPVKKGYGLYNSRCLKLYTNMEDYETARKRCEADGAHLFYFKSRELDGSALKSLMDKMGQVLNDIDIGLWVGADDISNEGNFQWNDGTPLSRDSGLWSNTQPDDYLGNEDCVDVGNQYGYVLNDKACSAKLGFVCQADIKDSNIKTVNGK